MGKTMKAFIIYVDTNTKSMQYAQQVKKSFHGHKGWEPELFVGVNVSTLPDYEKQFPIETKPNSRAEAFYNSDMKRYRVKKCCSLNHYRLFRKCVEMNEPIAVVEHDSFCVNSLPDIEWDDVLVLNGNSAVKQRQLNYIWDQNIQLKKNGFAQGVNDICIKGLVYRHDPEINGSHLMPGTAAYAITPKGAKKMIDVYENIGWEQSDFIINTAYVRIQTIVPELFTFGLPNLAMSHGVR